jgi:hypothetical protein
LKPLIVIFFVGFFAVTSYSQAANVIGPDAFLRGTPSEKGAVVDTLAPDSKVQIITRTGDWYLVQSSPFVGWLHRNSLKVIPGPNSGQTSSSVPGKKQKDPSGGSAPASAATTSQIPPSNVERVYIRGPRGGCYFVRPDGKKVYVAHSRCD